MPTIYREPLCPLKVLPLAAWCLVPCQRELPPLHRSYQLMRQTKILLMPRFHPCTSDLCRLLRAPAGSWPSRRYLCRSFSRCLAPYPGGTFVVHLPVSSHEASAFPPFEESRLPQHPHSSFSTVLISRLQAFSNVQASTFARHPDQLLPNFRSAAVTFTSEHPTVCYLPVCRIC